MSLLNDATMAIPVGFHNDGLSFGITLAAPAHQDQLLFYLAAHKQQAYTLPFGVTGAIRDTA